MKAIASHVWQIPLMPRQSINAYLVEDVLVDAGIRFSARRLSRELAGRDLSAHVLTHAHPDHQGASRAVCRARQVPLWCHAAERAAAESGNAVMHYPRPGGAVARIQQAVFAGPGHPVERTLAEGDRVAGFTVIETPGHSPGHISLFREQDGLLLAGDACVGMNLMTSVAGLGLPLRDATTDMSRARDSLRKLAALKPDRVAFGHGPAVTGAAFAAFVDRIG